MPIVPIASVAQIGAEGKYYFVYFAADVVYTCDVAVVNKRRARCLKSPRNEKELLKQFVQNGDLEYAWELARHDVKWCREEWLQIMDGILALSIQLMSREPTSEECEALNRWIKDNRDVIRNLPKGMKIQRC